MHKMQFTYKFLLPSYLTWIWRKLDGHRDLEKKQARTHTKTSML